MWLLSRPTGFLKWKKKKNRWAQRVLSALSKVKKKKGKERLNLAQIWPFYSAWRRAMSPSDTPQVCTLRDEKTEQIMPSYSNRSPGEMTPGVLFLQLLTLPYKRNAQGSGGIESRTGWCRFVLLRWTVGLGVFKKVHGKHGWWKYSVWNSKFSCTTINLSSNSIVQNV